MADVEDADARREVEETVAVDVVDPDPGGALGDDGSTFVLVIRKRVSAATIFFAFGPGIGTRIRTPRPEVAAGSDGGGRGAGGYFGS